MSAPPFDQSGVISSRMTDFPIYLRNIIIYPPLIHPIQNIRIEVIIILQAVGVASRSVRCALLIPVNTKRTDAQTHPRLGQKNGTLQFANQLIDILPPPVGTLGRFVAFGQSIPPEALIVREGLPGRRIGIKIIVHVDGIHVITGYNVFHHPADELAGLR